MNDTAKKILVEFSDYFNKSGVFGDIMRDAGYWLVKALRNLVDAAMSLYDVTYQLLDFTQYDPVQNYIKDLKPLWVAVFTLCLIALGLVLMISRNKPNKVFRNMLLSILVLSSSTYLIQELNSFILASKNAMGVEKEAVTTQVINNNLTDLLFVDKTNTFTDFDVKYKSLSEEFVKVMNMSEKVYPDTEGISDTAKEVFGYYVNISNDGNRSYQEFESSLLGLIDPPYYYRYKLNFIPVFLILISSSIIYLCVSYKVSHMIYSIVFHQILAYLYSAEMTYGNKLVKILMSLLNTYITLFFCSITLKIYDMAGTYLSLNVENALVQAILLLIIAVCTIDAPNIVSQVTGADAGMQSSFGKLTAAYTLLRGSGNAAGSLLYGNPYRGTKGLLNNAFSQKVGSLGKEGAGRLGDAALAGVGAGIGAGAAKVSSMFGAKDGNNGQAKGAKGMAGSESGAGDSKFNGQSAAGKNGDTGGNKETFNQGSDGARNGTKNGDKATNQRQDGSTGTHTNSGNSTNQRNDSSAQKESLNSQMGNQSGSNAKSGENKNGPQDFKKGMDKDNLDGGLKKEGFSGKENLGADQGADERSETGRDSFNSGNNEGQENDYTSFNQNSQTDNTRSEQPSFLSGLMQQRRSDKEQGTGRLKHYGKSIAYGFDRAYKGSRKKNLE